MAGTVEETGPPAGASFRSAMRYTAWLEASEDCRARWRNFYAVDADLLAHKPGNLRCARPPRYRWAIITAWEGLVDRAKIHTGHTVLIKGGRRRRSYCGSACRAFGAKVFARCRRRKSKVVENFGAIPID